MAKKTTESIRDLETLARTLGTHLQHSEPISRLHVVTLASADVLIEGDLIPIHGRGRTFGDACKQLVKRYDTQTLIFKAMRADRRELVFVKSEQQS